jgi:uncharacterized SAM-binding protein YcdF (DUF218 family)
MDHFDAVLVPGGGLTADHKPTPWVKARLDYALSVRERKYIIVLSAGTPHRPQHLDTDGFPIYESIAGARYIMEKGLPPECVMAETCSYDTIGNAFFARLLFTDPLSLGKLLVVTSAFHMPRTQEVFQWIFGLPPHVISYRLAFYATPDTDINDQDLTARIDGEKNRLDSFRELPGRIKSLPGLHRWIYTEHAVYAAHLKPQPVSGREANTY